MIDGQSKARMNPRAVVIRKKRYNEKAKRVKERAACAHRIRELSNKINFLASICALALNLLNLFTIYGTRSLFVISHSKLTFSVRNEISTNSLCWRGLSFREKIIRYVWLFLRSVESDAKNTPISIRRQTATHTNTHLRTARSHAIVRQPANRSNTLSILFL